MPLTTDAAASGTFTLGDLPVHRLGFGAMRICGPGVWGWPADRASALEVLRETQRLGINLIDTADSYGPETSELMIAEALHPYPEGLVIATKGGLVRPGPGEWRPDCRPRHLRDACENSLRRLRVERIDVYQLHTVDRTVPFEESVGELARLRQEGKIRHVALSNVNVAEIEAARQIVPIVSVQNRYNLTDRGSEQVVDHCEREGIGFIPWFPLAVGNLAVPGSPLDSLASELQATPAQVALAWLLRRSSTMLPIPGTGSVEHLRENTAAATLQLSDEQFARVEALDRP